MPGVREALERHQWKDVDREISRVAMALTPEATLVGQLAEELSQLK